MAGKLGRALVLLVLLAAALITQAPLAVFLLAFALVLLVLLVFNLVITPLLLKQEVTEVDYGTFMGMTERQEIGKVEIEDDEILFTNQDGKKLTFQIVVSNPPYIAEREKAQMDASVLDYEPHSALFVPDQDPLLFYRRIAELRLAPYLYFELNEAYAQQTADMLQSMGYQDIILKNDSYGKPRILAARTDLTR